MKRPSKINIKPKILIFTLTLLCIAVLILSVAVKDFSKPFKSVAGMIVIPLQEGANSMGGWFTDKSDLLKSVKELKKENDKLKLQVDELTEENSLLAQNKYELTRLRNMYQLDKDYSSLKKIGARVIGKDTGNFFNIFTINKGARDGIKEDMNVISDGGLVGIIYDVGENYSKVRSIIDDESSVSVSFANTSDTGIASGDLKLIEDGVMNITEIVKEAKVSEGDMVVTSRISNKFLPGILVGYVTEVSKDSNELTQSGKIVPVVDFQHIDEVLVITELKEQLKK
ncbi:MAG: rod shape-determining protein MreC [Eubacterium sp.]|jgi:rod shape-determining protein MreC|nr:rod shape-determining protein MreC [Eubacterium sp.]